VKLFFLSGLPRSGSTLLTTLLYQNPLIHTEGISALCEVMWQTHLALNNAQAIPANNRQEHAYKMIADLPNRYYSQITRPFVIDKCRAWPASDNLKMLRHYVTPNPKIVVLTRDPADIIASFKSLFDRNNRNDFDTSGMADEFNRNLVCTQSAKNANDPETFLFVDYKNLVDDTKTELNRVYEFLELKPYDHDLNDIVTVNPENDEVYGLNGMHSIRRTISYI